MKYENYLRVVNVDGIVKVYLCIDENEKEPMCVHELKNGEAIRIVGKDGGIASINENRLL